ncbi:MAG: hypothetical protein EZS28_008610 [Streblomastix strix]|uniref:Uncharacterized protein n=1 Tax=Streblomastix strix TaxID=222440 RepID=A0A5J4WM09_9EUKA|nr:MAG: hypothetical protein EZS28_008610 [Streblomastix strix]
MSPSLQSMNVMSSMASPRLSTTVRSIFEVDSPFEKDPQSVAQILTRHRSSIFEETIMPDPSLKMDGDLLMLDDVLRHDETLFGSTRYNTIAPDVYIRPEVNELLNEKADKTNLDDYYSKIETFSKEEVYTKTEADQLLSEKADKTEFIDSYSKNETDELLNGKVIEAVLDDYYSKTETYIMIETYNKTEVDSFLDEKVDIGTSNTKEEDDALLLLQVEKTQLIDSYTKTEDDAMLLLKADKSDLKDSYTKTEDDALLLSKAGKIELIDSYSKTETDQKLELKASITDLIDSFTKTEDDAILLLKAGKTDLIDSYSKINDDAMLLLKADKTYLIDSYSKDIAQVKSKGYVFATTEEINTWMDNQENVAKISIGDNLYIVDKEVMDYWWNGINLRIQETELPDMSSVVTILGAVTGGSNAITDISIDGNVLTPAKNTSFVTNNYDETVTGQKTFNTTIHSVGIMVQTNNNNSVVCAGGEIDYLISQIDVGDVDLTNYYNKTKTDELLGDKANSANLANYVTLGTLQTITANKTSRNSCRFVSTVDGMPTVTESSFVKSGADNTFVLLGADDQPYPDPTDDDFITLGAVKSEFVSSIYSGSINGNLTANQFIKSGKDDTSVLLAGGGDRLLSEFSSGGASIEDLTSQVAINVTAICFNYSSLAFVKLGNLYLYQMLVIPKQEGFASSMNFKIGTLPTQYAPTVSELYVSNGGPYVSFKHHITINIDEPLLDAAGLMDFPELYTYIKERDPKLPIVTEPPIPVGEQTLQEQVKINADILESTNEVFVPQEPNMPVKIDYGPQIVNKIFVFNELPQVLVVYGDRVTLNCFVTIKQQFKGYIFNSYPQETQLKDDTNITTAICNDFNNSINYFCYIDENSPNVYVDQDQEIFADTSLVISTSYYKQFEALKYVNYDSNNDGKVDILDIWNGS